MLSAIVVLAEARHVIAQAQAVEGARTLVAEQERTHHVLTTEKETLASVSVCLTRLGFRRKSVPPAPFDAKIRLPGVK